jgi:hypothetical protein
MIQAYTSYALWKFSVFAALIRPFSLAPLGLIQISCGNARSLPGIRKVGSIYQRPFDQPSAPATTRHRALRMISPLHTRTRSKSYSVRCIISTLTQLVSIASMISFSSHLRIHLWMYAILRLSTRKSLCLSSSPFNPVYVRARGCMTAQPQVMRILSTTGMRTIPSSLKSLGRSRLVSSRTSRYPNDVFMQMPPPPLPELPESSPRTSQQDSMLALLESSFLYHNPNESVHFFPVPTQRRSEDMRKSSLDAPSVASTGSNGKFRRIGDALTGRSRARSPT